MRNNVWWKQIAIVDIETNILLIKVDLVAKETIILNSYVGVRGFGCKLSFKTFMAGNQ